MKVWIVCDDEVYASESAALATVCRCLVAGLVTLQAESTNRKVMEVLLGMDDSSTKLVLDFWNKCACDKNSVGTQGPISLKEREVRE